jgi:hypothetical protein
MILASKVVLFVGYSLRDHDFARVYDLAYIEGYVNALTYLIFTDRECRLLPLYFVFGHKKDLKSLGQYKKACKTAEESHRAAYLSAVKGTKNLDQGIVLHHVPYLL